MSANYRKVLSDSYEQMFVFIPFLISFFKTSPRWVLDAMSFQIHVKRGKRLIAPGVSSVSNKGGKIIRTKYTEKTFTPPVRALSDNFTAVDSLLQEFGKTEYESADQTYEAQMLAQMLESINEIDSDMMRGLEYMASSIFDNGKFNYYDENGKLVFEIDFKPKTSHFATVSNAWGGAGATPFADITTLARQIKKDGGLPVKNLIFGQNAIVNFMASDDFKDSFDLRRLNTGLFDPRTVDPNEEADYLGDLLIGTKRYMCWTLDKQFTDPTQPKADPEVLIDAVDPDKVLFLPDFNNPLADFRLYFCKVPQTTKSDEQYRNFLPESMTMEDRQFNLRAWESKDDDVVKLEMKDAPLPVPVAIDTIGALKTTV